MGLKPPRHSRHRALYTYRDPLTAKLEHMAVTQTLDRLRGTELGALFGYAAGTRVCVCTRDAHCALDEHCASNVCVPAAGGRHAHLSLIHI